MPETPESTPGADSTARERLLELAQSLHEADHLEPDARRELADLLRELAANLSPDAPPEQASHLAESASHLVRLLHERPESGLIEAAKQSLEEATVRAGSNMPMAAELARRIVELLANLGI